MSSLQPRGRVETCRVNCDNQPNGGEDNRDYAGWGNQDAEIQPWRRGILYLDHGSNGKQPGICRYISTQFRLLLICIYVTAVEVSPVYLPRDSQVHVQCVWVSGMLRCQSPLLCFIVLIDRDNDKQRPCVTLTLSTSDPASKQSTNCPILCSSDTQLIEVSQKIFAKYSEKAPGGAFSFLNVLSAEHDIRCILKNCENYHESSLTAIEAEQARTRTIRQTAYK